MSGDDAGEAGTPFGVVEFHNGTDQPATLTVVDPNGHEHTLATLEPGATVSQLTPAGARWSLTTGAAGVAGSSPADARGARGVGGGSKSVADAPADDDAPESVPPADEDLDGPLDVDDDGGKGGIFGVGR